MIPPTHNPTREIVNLGNIAKTKTLIKKSKMSPTPGSYFERGGGISRAKSGLWFVKGLKVVPESWVVSISASLCTGYGLKCIGIVVRKWRFECSKGDTGCIEVRV